METVHNRWQSESQFQFQRVTQPPPPPVEELQPPNDELVTSVGDWERFVDPESGAPYWWNVKTGESTWEQPEGDGSDIKMQESAGELDGKDAVAAAVRRSKRIGRTKQSLAVRYSRSLPDSAFAKQFERPVFHNFGRGNSQKKTHSSRANAVPAKAKPVPAAQSTAPKPAHEPAASLQDDFNAAAGQSSIPSGADAPDSGAATATPADDGTEPQMVEAGAGHEVGDDEAGVAEPDPLNDLDPRSYRFLPPQWVQQIRPAGVRSSRTSSVMECMQLYN